MAYLCGLSDCFPFVQCWLVCVSGSARTPGTGCSAWSTSRTAGPPVEVMKVVKSEVCQLIFPRTLISLRAIVSCTTTRSLPPPTMADAGKCTPSPHTTTGTETLAGFFKGTSADQDRRFTDKDANEDQLQRYRWSDTLSRLTSWELLRDMSDTLCFVRNAIDW